MQAVEPSDIERVKGQLTALEAWIRDLSEENAALRRRLVEQEQAAQRDPPPSWAA